jgi:hypothetical protein
LIVAYLHGWLIEAVSSWEKYVFLIHHRSPPQLAPQLAPQLGWHSWLIELSVAGLT